jgi:hypothetical protein
MNTKLPIKNFELRHLKLNSKGQPSIDWFDLTQPNDLLSVESDSQPHEDLVNSLNNLKSVFAESLGLLEGWDFARENTRNNEEKLKEAIRGYNEQIGRCNVTGLTITDKGIKIAGSLICEGGVVGLPTPLIKFENDESEIGVQAQSIVDELKVEVWKFIYAEKRDNDLFNQKEEKKSGLNNVEGKMEKVA